MATIFDKLGDLLGFGGSSSSASATPPQVVSQEPWSGAKPALNKSITEALRLYNSDLGFKPYTGERIAAIDPRTTEALSLTEQMARAPSGLLDASIGAVQDHAAGRYLDPNTAPGYSTMLDDLTARATAAGNAGASASGRYGSRAHTDTNARAVTGAIAPHMFGAYQQNLGRQLQASSMAPMMNELRFDGATRLAGVGDYYQQHGQNRINSQIAQHDEAQARPWEQLGRLNAIATGAGQMGGTKSTTNPGPSGAQKFLGGAMSGAALGSMFGPIGTGIGALGGGLLGSW